MKHLTVRDLRELTQLMPDDMPVAVMLMTVPSKGSCVRLAVRADWPSAMTTGDGYATIWVDKRDIIATTPTGE